MAYEYYKCTSLDQVLPYPHYSNAVWDRPKVIFGNENAKHTNGEYSDRLSEWDYDKSDRAWKSVRSTRNTARAVQEYLSAYQGKSVRLTAIIAQTNRSNGYTVYYYQWIE